MIILRSTLCFEIEIVLNSDIDRHVCQALYVCAMLPLAFQAFF